MTTTIEMKKDAIVYGVLGGWKQLYSGGVNSEFNPAHW